MKGAEKPATTELPRIRDRISYIYVERCTISVEDSSITVTDAEGTVRIPSASLGTLMLGPGTSLTHRAAELIGDCGATIAWVGEKGVRFYAYGSPLTSSSRLLDAQAKKVSNIHSRLAVARRMYEMRFPGTDFSRMTMQQLRGREGSRVRSIYKKASSETGIQWDGREYDPDNFEGSTPVNQALSAANSCLYGLCLSVITALGCSPGLGFIHTGHQKSFVYDIADLYKADLTIPLSFRIAAESSEDVGRRTRLAFRDEVASIDLMSRITDDIRSLLLDEDSGTDEEEDPDMEGLRLWDRDGVVKAGRMYRGEERRVRPHGVTLPPVPPRRPVQVDAGNLNRCVCRPHFRPCARPALGENGKLHRQRSRYNGV